MTWIPVKVERSVSISASMEKVYAFLEDPPECLQMWPTIQLVEPCGEGNYHVVFLEHASAGLKFTPDQIVKFISNGKDLVRWLYVSGNLKSYGSFQIEKSGEAVTVLMKMENEADMAIPALMKPVAKSFAQYETINAVEAFLANLKKKMEGA